MGKWEEQALEPPVPYRQCQVVGCFRRQKGRGGVCNAHKYHLRRGVRIEDMKPIAKKEKP